MENTFLIISIHHYDSLASTCNCPFFHQYFCFSWFSNLCHFLLQLVTAGSSYVSVFHQESVFNDPLVLCMGHLLLLPYFAVCSDCAIENIWTRYPFLPPIFLW